MGLKIEIEYPCFMKGILKNGSKEYGYIIYDETEIDIPVVSGIEFCEATKSILGWRQYSEKEIYKFDERKFTKLDDIKYLKGNIKKLLVPANYVLNKKNAIKKGKWIENEKYKNEKLIFKENLFKNITYDEKDFIFYYMEKMKKYLISDGSNIYIESIQILDPDVYNVEFLSIPVSFIEKIDTVSDEPTITELQFAAKFYCLYLFNVLEKFSVADIVKDNYSNETAEIIFKLVKTMNTIFFKDEKLFQNTDLFKIEQKLIASDYDFIPLIYEYSKYAENNKEDFDKIYDDFSHFKFEDLMKLKFHIEKMQNKQNNILTI